MPSGSTGVLYALLDSMKDITEINVRINSPGGDVFDGVAIHNALERNPATVIVHIDGLAASIASVVAMAGDSILMADNALMMIHNPRTIVMGESTHMRNAADMLDKAKEALVNSYLAQVGDAKRGEVEAFMDETKWFTAAEALEFGLVDEVGNAVKIAAHFDLSQLKYANVPDGLKNQKPTVHVDHGATLGEFVENILTDPKQPDGMPVESANKRIDICEMVSKETP